MKLPFPFLKSKKQQSDYYLALLFTDEKASAVILKAEEGNLRRVNSHEAFLSESLEDISIDDLVTATDKAISKAEEVLPPDIQTHQTIFGVKAIWVDSLTKKIKKEYLEKLKKVCNALDLTPIGFMVTTEAITHLMQDEEGAPVSAIFADIEKKEITLSLLRGGKVVESVSSPHLVSTPATIDKLLGHFTVPVLPARIVVFQSRPDERTHHMFMAHQWSKQLPFLHVPQVTIIPKAFDMRSVMYGAAAQMGFAVIEEKHEDLPEIPEKVLEEEIAVVQGEEPSVDAIDTDSTESESALETAGTADVQGVEDASGTEGAKEFGFVVNQDISEYEPVSEKQEEELSVHPTVHHEENDTVVEQDYAEERKKRVGGEKKLPFLAALSSLSLPKKIKFPAVGNIFSKFKGSKTALIIIIPVVIIVVLIAGTIWFYYYKMQANVVLTMKPNMVSQDETVTFSTSQSNDFSNNVIAAKNVSATVNGQASTPATGKKDEGDKAKGTVTIYNNNSNSITLNSGTTVTANNGQVFLLDSTVTVASASGDVFSGTSPGTTQTTVTAKALGTSGNEPSGTTFAIGSDNTVAAKNDNAFSGGTDKTVTVVSSADITKLRASLISSVQDAAQQKLSGEATDGESVLPLVGSPTLQNENFDHVIGDEATDVSLTASVVVSGMAYATSDLDNFASTIAKQKYPQDPNVADKTIKESISNATQKSQDTASATVTIQAGLLPDINKADIISTIQNKSIDIAKNALTGLPQADTADITFSPPIPFLPLLFPTLPHHINLTISSE
jgi:hypothetical protein